MLPQSNSSFSTQLPTLQIAWDSTSLGLFKECEYKYYLTMVLGYVPRSESVHLTFGTLYHSALERYDHSRSGGADHEEALDVTLEWLLRATWNYTLRRPWASDDENKNRFTLVRTVVWYLDEWHLDRSDPCRTILLDNGRPAVELSFRFPTGIAAVTGEPFYLCGHMDRLVEFNSQVYVMDRKTSKNTINAGFFKKFSPDNQFTLYTLASHVVWNTPAVGLIVDAAQVAVTFSRFERGFVSRSAEILDEWFKDLSGYLAAAQHAASVGHWKMNDKACNNYGGCQFRDICSKSPSVRQTWLNSAFHKRVWDPLKVRGDI